jgi:sensor domain CHASE-containing protein
MPKRSFLPVFMALMIVLIAGYYSEKQNKTIHDQSLRADVLREAIRLQSRLEGALSADIQLVRGLVAVISTEPSMSQERFTQLGERVIGSHTDISHIAAAPDLVISMIYPLDGNEAALGLDYSKTEAQRDAAHKVRDSGEMVLAGPVQLVQGGTAFIGRFPVFTGAGENRRFWGILSLVMHAETLYATHGLNSADLGIEVALRGQDGLGSQGTTFLVTHRFLMINPWFWTFLCRWGPGRLPPGQKGGGRPGRSIPGPGGWWCLLPEH